MSRPKKDLLAGFHRSKQYKGYNPGCHRYEAQNKDDRGNIIR